MMKCIKFILVTIILGCSGTVMKLESQSHLTKEEAVQLAIENNFGIMLSQNASNRAKNNSSKYNTGQLPTVGVTGGYNFRLDNTSVNFQDGRSSDLNFAPSQSANVSVGAGYTIFDGFMRKYNIQQLQENFALSQLELEATMENIAAQALTQYYTIAALSENLKIINETIDISIRRLERAVQQHEYGQGNQLAILNAEVDLNNDSLNLINAEIQIENAKRLLNNLMIKVESVDYSVDSETEFITMLSKDLLKMEMLERNIEISQIEKTIEIGNLSIDIANARKLPVIGTNVSYGYSYNKNNSASFLSSQNSNGLNAGISLSWNIFDGGATRHALADARLNQEALALQKELLLENLAFEFDNAWAIYNNRLIVYRTQLKNLEIAKRNFERSEEQYKIGQINSVDFRQAQSNLLNTEITLSTVKFDIKLSEVELLLLSGRILD